MSILTNLLRDNMKARAAAKAEREAARIVTVHEYPPIPIRSFDWRAYRDGDEEAGNYGYGRTEQEAIEDLLANEESGL